jgi:predicted membrane channel-forming protein YqfA (hemolysin III family)
MYDGNTGESKFHLWGWILFVVCAGFFIASAVDSGSVIGLIGSIVFLFACLVFIAPLVRRRYSDKDG